jgi:hypothetical protein
MASRSARALAPLALLGLVILGPALVGCGPARGPRSALDRYIRAVEQDHPGEAYDLLSEKARRSLSRDEFARRLRMHRAEALAQVRELRQARRQKGSLAMEAEVPLSTAASGQASELVLEGQRWRLRHGLHRGSLAATPQLALRSFLQAVEKGDLERVLRLLSPRVRENLERELRQRADRLRMSLDKDSIVVQGNRAELRYDRHYRIQLVRENGEWLIANFD